MVSREKLEVGGFGISHIGRLRSKNEDSIYIDSWGRFALLADGMGGHLGGAEASRMAIQCLRSYLEEYSPEDTSAQKVCEFLRQGFLTASAKVFEKGESQPEFHAMGSTLVVWAHYGEKTFVAHVGDSRAYLLRENMIFCMTQDHNFANEQMKSGLPRPQGLNLNMKHVIFRNIGSSPPSEPSLVHLPYKENDVWILCTDGLSNKLSMVDMQTLSSKCCGNLAQLNKVLVEEAYLRGGDDNISVIVLETKSSKELKVTE